MSANLTIIKIYRKSHAGHMLILLVMILLWFYFTSIFIPPRKPRSQGHYSTQTPNAEEEYSNDIEVVTTAGELDTPRPTMVTDSNNESSSSTKLPAVVFVPHVDRVTTTTTAATPAQSTGVFRSMEAVVDLTATPRNVQARDAVIDHTAIPRDAPARDAVIDPTAFRRDTLARDTVIDPTATTRNVQARDAAIDHTTITRDVRAHDAVIDPTAILRDPLARDAVIDLTAIPRDARARDAVISHTAIRRDTLARDAGEQNANGGNVVIDPNAIRREQFLKKFAVYRGHSKNGLNPFKEEYSMPSEEKPVKIISPSSSVNVTTNITGKDGENQTVTPIISEMGQNNTNIRRGETFIVGDYEYYYEYEDWPKTTQEPLDLSEYKKVYPRYKKPIDEEYLKTFIK